MAQAYREFLKHPPSPKIAAVGGAVIPCHDRQPPWWIDSKHGGFDRGDKPLLLSNGALSGCNSAYHREAVRAVGLFDEQLGYKGDTLIPREESELQDRLIRAGWEIWWLPRAAVQHHVEDERLTVKGMARSAFNSGRAAAIHRLKITTPASRRLALRLTRLLATPFHITINLVQALLLFVLGKQRPAIGALCRVTQRQGGRGRWLSLISYGDKNPLNFRHMSRIAKTSQPPEESWPVRGLEWCPRNVKDRRIFKAKFLSFFP